LSDRVTRREAVRSWLDYELLSEGGGIRLRCSLASGEDAEARLAFPLPGVMRFQIAPGLLAARPTEDLAPLPAPSVAIDVHATDQGLIIAAPPLLACLQAAGEPWRLHVLDAHGAPIFAEEASGGPPLSWEQHEDGSLSASLSFALSPDEALFGLGAQSGSLNHRGRTIRCQISPDGGNADPETSAIPFLWSTCGYGLFVHTPADVLFHLGSRSPAACSATIDDGQLDYFLIYGPGPREILCRYAQVTGFAPPLPRAAFGIWITRPASLGTAAIEEDCVTLRARHIPCDGVHIAPPEPGGEPAATLIRPEPLASELEQIEFRLGLTVRPSVTQHTRAFKEAARKGYLVRGRNARPLLRPGPEGPEALVDLTLPVARAWWQAQLREALPLRASAFLAGEGNAPEEGLYHDGTPGPWMHNRYPQLCQEAVQEVLRAAAGEETPLLWAQTAWAGSQRLAVYRAPRAMPGPAYLMAQLRAALSLSLSGMPFWSPAFALRQPGQDAALYVRACQLAFLAPLARWDGSLAGIRHDAEAIIRAYARLRNQLAPYICAAAASSAHDGLPLARPLVVDYPDDRNTWWLDRQYLLGPHLLIAAAWEAEAELPIYLPDGTWIDYWTDQMHRGPTWYRYPVTLERLPILVRAGAIIPTQPAAHTVSPRTEVAITFHIYPQRSGEMTLYDEDGAALQALLQVSGDEFELLVPPLGSDCEIILHAVPAPLAVTLDGQPLACTWKAGQAAMTLGRGRRLHYQARESLSGGYRI